MKALLVNCTLKASPAESNTGALAEVVADALRGEGVEVGSVRAADHSILPGPGEDYSETEEGHEWSHSTGRAAASNLLAAARALANRPIPAPPSG